MKLYEAKNIITEVFENPFDKDKFSYFIRNLLKNLHPAEFRRSGYNIPKAFEDFIASYERLGKYEDEEGNLIDVLIIKLKRDHSIDYARSTQRNFVRWYLNDKGKDAALVAFTTEKSSEWRFSFIKMQYSLEKKKDELTPAKRSSFLVGESGNSHTAQRQLIDLLKNDHTPYLSDIEDAFSIEAVSDEFYEKYKALLFNLVDEIENVVKRDKTVKDEFESKEISILNFSKKLLGQIVFLYFLQKKGWLGLEEKEKYGEGDKNFLRSLFNKIKKGENFFNDYLEYLFYDALSKKRVTDYYERFKTRIPFLNGGLFDPIEFYDWQKTDIVIPNEIFSNRKGDDEGTGILDVFDLYNFTVKEDEPLETEVAIDPEMLGKVFERMLEVTERRSKGAFYTPREIVHYMAKQSLLYFLETELQNNNVPKADLETFIHYGEHIIDKDIAIEEGKLKQTANKQSIPESIRRHADEIDQALKNIKICDPAVGSGAFPVGIMNEIVKLRKLLTPFMEKESVDERSAYRFKSNAIQNSIYGVDIDAGAVEIAKLRLWLSMVVDEERINTIEPLPNLEYKIVQGNSLINIPDGTAINDALATEIENLTTAYFHITDKEKKQEQKQLIDSKIYEQLKFVSEIVGYNIDFDFKLIFHDVYHEKGGFNVVIGNPPFVRHELFKEYKKDLKANYSNIYDGRADLYTYFMKKGFDILHHSGTLSFITSNKYILRGYGKKIRNLLSSEKTIKTMINFGELPVFKASVDSTIIVAKNRQPSNSDTLKYSQATTAEHIKNIDKLSLQNSIIKKISTLKTSWVFKDEKTMLLLKKLNEIENKLIDVFEIFGGIKTGCDKAFIIDNFTRLDLINKDKNSEKIIKPWFRGRDIQKWISSPELFIIYIPQNEINIDDFPAIKEHLNNYRFDLEKRATNQKWFELQQPQKRFTKLFESDKIIYGEISKEMRALFDKGKAYGTMKMFFIPFNPIILAILNSKLFDWYARMNFSSLGDPWNGGRLEFKTIYMSKVPIPIFSPNVERHFQNVIDNILFLKSQPIEKMSFYFEQLIDGMVYELYFEKEIKQAGCDILKYLDDLPEIKDEMPDEEKLKIITKVFNKLYDKESPVRKNLFFMDSVEEVAIIKKSLEK